MTDATALIAEDEPLLAQALQAELARAWPELRVLATVGNGAAAVREALAHRPQVLFFDIRMPGMSGIEAAAELADEWPEATPFPALVFVTAYDQYAVQAFEAQAVDYVLKPVQPARLQKTVAKLQELLARRSNDLDPILAQLRSLLPALSGLPAHAASPASSVTGAPFAIPAPSVSPAQAGIQSALPASPSPSAPAPSSPQPLLKVIQASVGSTIRMVPIDDVLYFEAADKYLRVLTGEHEYLIRAALKELLPQLDPQLFWQVHRGTVVRATAIEAVTRDEAGKLHLQLRGRPERLGVSRLYAHLFKAM